MKGGKGARKRGGGADVVARLTSATLRAAPPRAGDTLIKGTALRKQHDQPRPATPCQDPPRR